MTEPFKLDRIDLKILEILQVDGRISNVDLASKVALSPSPCLERVRRLERQGYITKYVALLDAEKLDASTVVFVQVSLKDTSTKKLAEFNRLTTKHDEVEACHMVAGGFDYLLKVRCKDMQHYQRFLGEKLASISVVSSTHTYVVIEEVKNETAISLNGISGS